MPDVLTDGSIVSLVVDGVEQSRIDTDHPARLEFEYMQHMDAVVRAAWSSPHPLRAAHVGGGLCALPLAWATSRAQSRQIVFEVDEGIALMAREFVPLPRKPLLRIRVADGREALEGSQAMFSVIIRDAFASSAVPHHLQTREWYATVKRRLNGIYLANTSHGKGSDARGDVAGAVSTFSTVALIADAKVLRGARWGNIVIAGWDDAPIELPTLERELRKLPLPVSMLVGPEVSRWLGGVTPLADSLPTV